MTATDAQIRIAMRERSKGRTQEQAAAKANLRSRKTVAKYEKLGELPTELGRPRTYRTRPNAFEEDWQAVADRLKDAPTLEAKALFDWLCEEKPGKYRPGQLRTFQRHVQVWRGLNGTQLVSLPQIRRPGHMMQVDGTSMNELGVTIGGQLFPHILMHAVLPYSNWEWGRVVQSESLAALHLAVVSAVEVLGHVPEEVQTDPSSAATHAQAGEERRTRGFNKAYVAFLDQLGIKPASTHTASPDENGDVEAANGSLKRALNQALLIRGSREFSDIRSYEEFLFREMRRRNDLRRARLDEELAVMRSAPPTLPPPVREVRGRVGDAGTMRVANRPYSLPSGLKGQMVTALVSEWSVSFWYAGKCVRTAAREPGLRSPCIDYRHIISTLLRKPGGFRGYRYFDSLFPQEVFKAAWEGMQTWLSPRRADLAYLRILKLAAETLEVDVAEALRQLLLTGQPFDDEAVRRVIQPAAPAIVPAVDTGAADPEMYDHLLSVVAAG